MHLRRWLVSLALLVSTLAPARPVSAQAPPEGEAEIVIGFDATTSTPRAVVVAVK